MTYAIKVLMYAPSVQDPANLESKDFWERVNLFHELPRRKQTGYQLEDFRATRPNREKSLQNKYSDRAGNPVVVKLEFDIQPEIFVDLEKAGLKIGTGGDVEVSIYAISELGITLFLEYYPYDQEKDLSVFNGNIFIPFHRVVSINALHGEAIDSVYVNKAILKGNVESKEK